MNAFLRTLGIAVMLAAAAGLVLEFIGYAVVDRTPGWPMLLWALGVILGLVLARWASFRLRRQLDKKYPTLSCAATVARVSSTSVSRSDSGSEDIKSAIRLVVHPEKEPSFSATLHEKNTLTPKVGSLIAVRRSFPGSYAVSRDLNPSEHTRERIASPGMLGAVRKAEIDPSTAEKPQKPTGFAWRQRITLLGSVIGAALILSLAFPSVFPMMWHAVVSSGPNARNHHGFLAEGALQEVMERLDAQIEHGVYEVTVRSNSHVEVLGLGQPDSERLHSLHAWGDRTYGPAPEPYRPNISAVFELDEIDWDATAALFDQCQSQAEDPSAKRSYAHLSAVIENVEWRVYVDTDSGRYHCTFNLEGELLSSTL